MKIIYDNQIFTLQKYGGISRYYHEITAHIGDSYAFELTGAYCGNEYVSRRRPGAFPYNGVIDACINSRLVRYNVLRNVRSLKRGAFDVFHPTYFDPYFLRYLGKRPFVLMVPDMIYELFPEDFGDSGAVIANRRTLLGKAAAIVTLSGHARDDIRRLCPVDADRIRVIPPGPSLSGTPDPALVDQGVTGQLPDRYLLFVGKRDRYKNFSAFAEAAAPLVERDRHLHIVCAGGRPLEDRENGLLARLRIANKVRQYDVSDDTLMELYRRAVAFVFPSRYEGFGFPVLEAFACGCPAVLANATSLPEVAGDAGLYFDPGDISSLRAALVRVLEDDGLRAGLVARGRARGRQFTWKKCIGELSDVYRQVSGT
jgi:glycosyltransferase involved in cell wall biosynthesis